MKLRRTRPFMMLCVLGALAVMTGGCYTQIPPTNSGIRFNANSGVKTKLYHGVVWVGWADSMILYPNNTKYATYVRGKGGERPDEDDSIKASTLEGAILPTDVTVAYHVDPAQTVEAFTSFGSDDLETIQREYIRWVAIYGVNVVSGRYSLFDLTSKDRAKFGPEVKKEIDPILKGWGITVDDVFIREVHTKDYDDKIREKLAFQTTLATERVKLQQATVDAQTTITDAKRIAAENKLLASQGDHAIALKKQDLKNILIDRWDGVAPVNGDGIPFVDSVPGKSLPAAKSARR